MVGKEGGEEQEWGGQKRLMFKQQQRMDGSARKRGFTMTPTSSSFSFSSFEKRESRGEEVIERLELSVIMGWPVRLSCHSEQLCAYDAHTTLPPPPTHTC